MGAASVPQGECRRNALDSLRHGHYASPVPSCPASPPPAARYARITDTGGLGVNLRREPASSSATVAALPESAVVRLLGPEQRGSDGRVWRQVEDSQGNQGWVPADFTVESAGPPGR